MASRIPLAAPGNNACCCGACANGWCPSIRGLGGPSSVTLGSVVYSDTLHEEYTTGEENPDYPPCLTYVEGSITTFPSEGFKIISPEDCSVLMSARLSAEDLCLDAEFSYGGGYSCSVVNYGTEQEPDCKLVYKVFAFYYEDYIYYSCPDEYFGSVEVSGIAGGGYTIPLQYYDCIEDEYYDSGINANITITL